MKKNQRFKSFFFGGCDRCFKSAGFTGEYLVSRLQEKGISCNFVKLDRGYTRINVKMNGIVMTIVNGMGPKIPLKKVDELLGQ